MPDVTRIPIQSREQWLELRRRQRRRRRNPRVLFDRHWIPEPNSGCWLWTGAVARFGYGSMRYQGKTAVAHRLAWLLYKGPIPDGLQLCHRCDVASCVNPDHLFFGSQSDNIQDCLKKGRHKHGHRNAKLNDEHARAIIVDPRSHSRIAADFGVSKGVISNIKAGRAWRHVR